MAISLPKIQIGRFLRKKVAPLIPGGEEAANAINSVIKDVKGSGATGSDIVPATQAALHNVNAEAVKRQVTTWILLGAGVLVLVLIMRRR